MKKFNWNYPTSMWIGENRIKDLCLACKNLDIKKPLLVTDKGLGQSAIIIYNHDDNDVRGVLEFNKLVHAFYEK